MSVIRCCDLCGKPLMSKSYKRYKIKREWYSYPFGGWERIEAHDDCVRKLLGKRRDDCPLVPVQPHGRLIDADTLEVDIRKDAKDPWYEETSPLNWADAFYEFADMVADAPTIIPASEEGE